MPSPLQEISQAIAAAQSAGRSFAARAAAAEALEIHALDRLEILAQGGWDPAALRPLQAGAQAALAGLEAAQQRTLGRLRGRIRAGLYSGPGLRRALLRHAGPAGPAGAFDGMDPLLQGLLGQGEPAGPRRPLEPDMVAYQPTPARAILALVQASGIGPQDLLVDLGSGLGQVALLAALLSGARARGVELEPSYVDYARACAQGLQLGRVEFIHADAREAPLDGGTVYYLFTPFRGRLLERVLERLRGEAGLRSIKVCTYGPCTVQVSQQSWLAPVGAAPAGEPSLGVFQSR
jgi:hypothetical protein